MSGNLTIGDVARVCAEVHGFEVQDLKSRTRVASVVRPRMLAYYMARRFVKASYSEIGQFFNRDHTTVIHGEEQCFERWVVRSYKGHREFVEAQERLEMLDREKPNYVFVFKSQRDGGDQRRIARFFAGCET